MVWKTVIIAVAIVFASVIVGGAIIVAQALANSSFDERGRESGDPGQSSQQVPPRIEGVKVSIADNDRSNSYSPNPVEIKAGETITWINDDSAVHTVTSSDGAFDSGVLRRGETFSFTFDKEGEYPYFCALHPNMAGTVAAAPDE
ncbi:MAG: cupredoxin domain-containing protein [Nitrososphaera sp.]|uniref:cupredoxin domain-containing protein n=1 Tax=Nitrososphaera sp. TaxID=1971748 RepID=UPI003D70136D